MLAPTDWTVTPQFQDLHFISQPALLETSGWLVLGPMLTRVVWRCVTMEHGEQCVMITGVVWMQVWPADNWASLGTVSFSFLFMNINMWFLTLSDKNHICSILCMPCFFRKSTVCNVLYMDLKSSPLSCRCSCIPPCFLWPGNWIHLARQFALYWHWVQTVWLPCQCSRFAQLWPLWGC